MSAHVIGDTRFDSKEKNVHWPGPYLLLPAEVSRVACGGIGAKAPPPPRTCSSTPFVGVGQSSLLPGALNGSSHKLFTY